MKESDNLKKSKSSSQPLPEVSEKEEKEMLASIRLEACSFVPDKLLDIMKRCGLYEEVNEEDEKEVLLSLNKESESFLPNSLGSIKKATGTYNPYLGQDELAINEKVKNEGQEIVPDVSKKVYAETGTRKRFSFKKHWVSLTSALLVMSASIAVVVVASTQGLFDNSVSGSFISMTITPASYAYNKNKSGSVQSAYGSANVSGGEINNNMPSWSFIADSSNIVQPSKIFTDNYSAKLVDFSISEATTSFEVAKSIVPSSFKKGYLETKSKQIKNVITITVFSSDSSYYDKYYESYQTSLSEALTSNKIYSDIEFNCVDLSKMADKLNDNSAPQLLRIYKGLNVDGRQFTISELEKIPTKILDKIETVLSSLSTAKLSMRSIDSIREGLSMSLGYYNNYFTLSSLSEDEADTLKEDLIAHAGGLPWGKGGISDNRDAIKDGLENKAYYFLSDRIGGSDGGKEWKEYVKLREYYMSETTRSLNSYLDVLDDMNELLDKSSKGTGYLPDGIGGEMPDPGNHDHGDGPDSPSWGDGGIGSWDDEEPPEAEESDSEESESD
ncbi:MAG: hypothetical protein LKE31_04665 [Bacilli bacterium]|jgi:hypothetical protein|nr:hypothetical protein [Bacilli bacterium]